MTAACLSLPLSATLSGVALAQQPASVTTGDSGSPQPLSHADLNLGGANNGGKCGAYCSTRNRSLSLNGNGGGAAVGKPCAGCVGKADNKNPKGQAPNGTDHNAGYECDRNHGVGRSNPAHTGCKPPTTVVCVPPAAACAPPKDCRGVVNGTATAADCRTLSTGGGAASGPVEVVTVPVTFTLPAVNPPAQPTLGSAGAAAEMPALGSGQGAALPFTGDASILLGEGAALLALIGAALLLASRKVPSSTA
jgi:hypothetical protein